MNRYSRWQWQNFIIMVNSYGIMYLCRKSFSYLIPAIIQEENLGKSELGAITSSINLSYTFSKFVCGVLSDRLQPRSVLTIGLIVVGLLNIQFANSSSVVMFSLCWFLNGIGQGCGWPPCGKLLKQWFHPSELGTWWSILSASANVFGAIGPLILSMAAHEYGWRTSMTVSGCACILSAVISYAFIKNCPEDVGLPPIVSEKDNKPKTEAIRTSTVWDLLRSPFLWSVSLIFFLKSFQAGAFIDWAQLLLIQEKGHSSSVASNFLSAFNIGGIVGSVASGYITDKLVARRSKHDNRGSPRYPVMILTSVCCIFLQYYLLNYVTSESSGMTILALSLLIGFCLYSNIAIIGVIVIENSPEYLTGTSHAIACLAANFGKVLSGYPLTYISSLYGWIITFSVVLAMDVISLVVLLASSTMNTTIGQSSAKKID